MTQVRGLGAKLTIGVVSTLIIIFCALLLTGSPPLYERHVARSHGWPVEGHADQRVVEWGSWWLNGRIYGDGPYRNSFHSTGLCYVIVDANGGRRKHLCRGVLIKVDRKAKTSTISF